MLDQVEEALLNLPSISFEEFYTQYVEKVQDDLLCAESRRLAAQIYGAKSIAAAERSIERLIEGMVSTK